MSNRIEEAIRTIIFKRKQKDALLETIIKQSLFEDDPVSTRKPKRRVTILKKAPKNVRATAAKYGGIAYRVVIRGKGLSTGEINNLVQGKTAGNSQIGALSPPWNSGDYTYVVSTQADVSTTDTKYNFYIVNVIILPNSFLRKYELPINKQTGSSIINKIGSSNMITASSLLGDYENLPQDLINALEVKDRSKYSFDKILAQLNSIDTNSTDTESETETDIISDVTDQPIGKLGGVFTGKYNATKGIPIEGVFKQRNMTLDGTFSYDDTSNRWWFSDGTWQTPDQIRIGKFTENGVFTDGKYQFTNREPITSMPDVSYRVYHGFKTSGDIDTKNNNSKIFAYDASNKVISYYEGTFNLDGNPNNGTLYNDDSKSTIIGTFTNGKYADATK